ncbi:MAG TPA: trypsin-like peptidase domain-containing protein [Asanoa sp.]
MTADYDRGPQPPLRPAPRAPTTWYGPPPVSQQRYAPPGYPETGYRDRPYPEPMQARAPYVAPAQAQPRPRRSRLQYVTLALVVLLGAVAVYQAVRIQRLTDRLAAHEKVLVESQAGDRARLDGLDGRATEIEKRQGSAFDPEAISTAALPSVFRVNAGDTAGTAFAVGKPASGGGTNLFTNYHVVESLYSGGGRKVYLERKDKRYPATIVKVDKTNDVAQLKADAKFTGLATLTGEVKSGQQIVVVGAPLGLTDSVTTGVVSAVRKLRDSPGPMIQFSAPINPGNSGGPVINSAKQVVGIATAKAVDAEGIGLAVPISVACGTFKVC